jgi:hypothetical protein
MHGLICNVAQTLANFKFMTLNNAPGVWCVGNWLHVPGKYNSITTVCVGQCMPMSCTWNACTLKDNVYWFVCTQVSAEDTVLYTAQYFFQKQSYQNKQQTMNKLAPLVRCPHLSQFWLSASVLSSGAHKLLLRDLQPQLKQLLLVKQAHGAEQSLTAEVISDYVDEAPESWLLPARDIQPVSSRELDWEVDVAAIRQAVQDSASQQIDTKLWSPTLLHRGVRWAMYLECDWDASNQGSTVDMFAKPKNLPSGALYRCKYSLECVGAGVDTLGIGDETNIFSKTRDWGCADFFEVKCMPGGFDEAAWAAKGLPSSGSIRLRLTVEDADD